MRRPVVWLVVLAAMCAGVVAGCGSQSSPNWRSVANADCARNRASVGSGTAQRRLLPSAIRGLVVQLQAVRGGPPAFAAYVADLDRMFVAYHALASRPDAARRRALLAHLAVLSRRLAGEPGALGLASCVHAGAL